MPRIKPTKLIVCCFYIGWALGFFGGLGQTMLAQLHVIYIMAFASAYGRINFKLAGRFAFKLAAFALGWALSFWGALWQTVLAKLHA